MTVDETAEVVMRKVPNWAPAATVADAGTVTLAPFTLRNAVVPPEGAKPAVCNLPCEPTPPLTDVGVIVKANNPPGFNVRSLAMLTPLKVAVTVRVTLVDDTEVPPSNVAVD